MPALLFWKKLRYCEVYIAKLALAVGPWRIYDIKYLIRNLQFNVLLYCSGPELLKELLKAAGGSAMRPDPGTGKSRRDCPRLMHDSSYIAMLCISLGP